MRKASFKVVNANSNSSLHNSRQNAPKYLIEDENFKENYYEQIHTDDEFRKLAELKYLSTKNQKMQERQKVALIKETVLNLEEHHTEQDVKKLFKNLNEEYGGHYITELAIHRDEGHFEKDGIAYYPTKHILKKNDDWYIVPLEKFLDKDFKATKKDFSEKVDIKDFKKVKNIHAHVKFSMFDLNTGLTGRMTKGQVSKRLKVVADELKLAYVPEKKISSGKAIKTIKDEHDLNRRAQIQELYLKQENSQLQEENQTLQYNFREYQKRITAIQDADKEQKKELHRLNTSVKKKETTVEELEKKISELKNRDQKLTREKEDFKSQIDTAIEKFKEIAPESENIIEAVAYVKELRKENQKLKNQEPVVKEVEKIVEVENPETEKQLISARERIEELESTTSTQKEHIEELEKTVSSQNEDIFGFQKTAEKAEKELSEARETIEMQKATISTLQSEKSVLTQDMSQIQAENEKYKDAVKEALTQKQYEKIEKMTDTMSAIAKMKEYIVANISKYADIVKKLKGQLQQTSVEEIQTASPKQQKKETSTTGEVAT